LKKCKNASLHDFTLEILWLCFVAKLIPREWAAKLFDIMRMRRTGRRTGAKFQEKIAALCRGAATGKMGAAQNFDQF